MLEIHFVTSPRVNRLVPVTIKSYIVYFLVKLLAVLLSALFLNDFSLAFPSSFSAAT